MANSTLSFSLIFCIVLHFTFDLDVVVGADFPGIIGNVTKGYREGTWCVAKPSTDHGKLEENIEFACKEIGVDCSIIQEGGLCFYPNTIINHASIAMNLYYHQAGSASFNCDFGNSGLISTTDPKTTPPGLATITTNVVGHLFVVMFLFGWCGF